ncbi:YjbF family lipoprotein [Paracoccus marinaquae]|uniref:YjbF family lipoprotein n=1 Tax=Paracoccus marinaquae TaxID=2841926 RepID=A0ABS6AI30_9RHOB|nr:YjbF family lipoprotein [Paracoccus marinaquae]MBU3030198.1 YjbF family lipoprotein [Paracoccus marinaquae]
MTTTRNRILAAALLPLLAACGSDTETGGSPWDVLARTAVEAAAAKTAPGAPAAQPKSPEEAAAEALRVNPGPLIRASFELLNQNPIMAMAGQNGDMRTYMTPAEDALILRNGLLVGTRGLGQDLSVAVAQTEPLIRAGRAGSGQRTMYYYTGDGLERPLQFACTVGAGPKPGVMVEDCEGHGASFQNSYLVQGGQVPVSRQWIGPALGYVTIQTLRP